jgi:RimJ/RimL family protein N-acetyltransferase
VGQTDEELFEAILHRTEEGLLRGSELRMASFLAHADASDGSPQESTTLIGFVNLTSIIRGAFESAFVSWSTRSDRVGEGFASEAVAGLLDVAFESSGLGLHRVQANIMPRNVASIRVAERNGFRREGLAERYLCIDGVWEDHVMFARTVEEHFGSAPGESRR